MAVSWQRSWKQRLAGAVTSAAAGWCLGRWREEFAPGRDLPGSGGADFSSEVAATETPGGIRQLRYGRYIVNDGHLVIEEGVENWLGSGGALPTSTLVVTDTVSGCRLDLGELLPAECRFSPSALIKVGVDFHREARRIRSRLLPVDLRSYSGAAADGEFYFNREAKRVAYGNLTTPGAFLYLLHEIAHAWQFATRQRSAKKDFFTLFNFLATRLHNLGVRIEEKRCGAISEERLHHFIGLARGRLAEKEIALDIENVTGRCPVPDFGHSVFKARSGKRFSFRSPVFEQALAAYVGAERDGWAFALWALRLLRCRGIDLEPGLRSLTAARTCIYPFLEQYQESIDSQLEMGNGRVRFVRKAPCH
ncbi:MAG: hypothetical protein JXB25_04660 [Deltaproteobacteria bacterium]|nr:hypothetical protein [Deltaproteobacteria bacterium]